MSDLTRAEIEEFWDTWLEINREAERINDWRIMADWYTEDATYGWMYSPEEHFMAIGRDEIRDLAIGQEMAGLDGWHYDYQATMIDEVNKMVVGFWKQRSGIIDDATGKEFEILGIGGSWFGVERQTEGPDAGKLLFTWQRDWFDLGSTVHTFMALASSGKAPQPLLDRMRVHGPSQKGHYTHDELPSPLWPPDVEAGKFLTQTDAPEASK